jgi:hypothetical protein
MIVNHKNLYVFKKGWSFQHCANYSKLAEEALADLLGIKNRILAEGYHPEFDLTDVDTGLTYEIKFQFHGEVDIEFEQEKNTNPSGISVSTADYWLIVNTSSTMSGEMVGKIRKYKLADLKYAVETRHLAGMTEGKKKCRFDPRDLPHEWLGDIHIDLIEKTWDLTGWKFQARPRVSFKRKPSRNPFPNRTDNIQHD